MQCQWKFEIKAFVADGNSERGASGGKEGTGAESTSPILLCNHRLLESIRAATSEGLPRCSGVSMSSMSYTCELGIQ